ncbi:MAG: DegT/DnrJ/EryC1/StrS family aminotransferase [Thermoplasmata archaeon]|nr:MAG: DegT/DnrJ/EryC1/StrS family aminotransferase [Thermoplasmata archaeon]
MDIEEFRRRGHETVDWMADYMERVEGYPVLSQVSPGDINRQLPPSPPAEGEPYDDLMTDLDKLIMPGITHWQHPSFFAYFPANTSPPSVLAEMVVSTLAPQCMLWQTSPAATELETRVMEWLREMLGLPTEFTGVIQDTASTATLCAILSARETVTNHTINETGFVGKGILTAYCSTETHSSIEKGVKIAGLGKENLRKVPVDAQYAMDPEALEAAIEADKAQGRLPTIVVATVGTTGSTAIDPIRAIGEVCDRQGVWLHVDAAHAGTALVCPEFRWMADGVEHADSFVMNPHKWMLTTLPTSAYFVRDPEALVRTFEIMPEYLRTKAEGVVNYRDWGVPLGRRFTALKLWFVIRSYGVEGLRRMVRRHVELAHLFKADVDAAPDFETMAPSPVNLVCFRYRPPGVPEEEVNALNESLLERLNATGKVFLTHTRLDGRYTLRLVVGQTLVEQRHVRAAWELIQRTARGRQ